MKNLYALSVLSLAMLLCVSSCKNSDRSIDAERLNAIITREVKMGDSEQRLLEFYKAYDWGFGYNKLANAYRSSFVIDNRNNILAHMVVVEVLLDKEKRVREINVTDAMK